MMIAYLFVLVTRILSITLKTVVEPVNVQAWPFPRRTFQIQKRRVSAATGVRATTPVTNPET